MNTKARFIIYMAVLMVILTGCIFDPVMPEATPTPVKGASQASEVAYPSGNVTGTLNVRNRCGLEGTVFGQLKEGDIVIILSVYESQIASECRTWYVVTNDDITGCSCSKYIDPQ